LFGKGLSATILQDLKNSCATAVSLPIENFFRIHRFVVRLKNFDMAGKPDSIVNQYVKFRAPGCTIHMLRLLRTQRVKRNLNLSCRAPFLVYRLSHALRRSSEAHLDKNSFALIGG